MATVALVPRHVLGGEGQTAPSGKPVLAGVGVGGVGYGQMQACEKAGFHVAALCDVDDVYAKKAFDRWPDARRYRDFREMLDKEGSKIDAVYCGTPDHTHAIITLAALRLKKHVCCVKPLTRTIEECRFVAKVAREAGVATQVTASPNTSEPACRTCELIWSGAIGAVREVHIWSNRPLWPQGMLRPPGQEPVPATLDWDLWIGPAPMRPFVANWPDDHLALQQVKAGRPRPAVYHPWNFRGWWDFGTGALGDMGCHILDPAFMALQLEFPASVQGSSTPVNTESPPNAQFVRYEFPRRDNLPKVAMPEVTLHWYDGGMMPPRPDELLPGEMMGDLDGGCIFHGTRGKIMCGAYARNPQLLPAREMEHFNQPAPLFRRIPGAMTGGHEQDWIRACKESRDTRLEASSHFGYAGPLNEMVVMGVLAVRLQSLQRKLLWDGKNMRFTNIGYDDRIKVLTRDRFEVINGDPRFSKEYATLPAAEMAEEWIRHTYRGGWEQI